MLDYSTLTTLLQTEFINKKGNFNSKKPLESTIQQSIYHYTQFLNYDAPIVTRVSYILNSIKTQLTCIECNAPRKIFSGNLTKSQFCSIQCSKQSPITKEKREATNLEKYGVTNQFKNVDKIKNSVFNKYGVYNPSHDASVRLKISNANKKNSGSRIAKANSTNLEKYGVKWAAQSSEVRSKITSTNLEKYGVISNFSRTDVQEQIQQTNLKNWGSRNVSSIPEIKEKIKQTKNRNYGNPSYNNRSLALSTMSNRYGTHYAKAHWDQNTLAIMENHTLLEEFVKNKTVFDAASQLKIAPTTLRNTIEKYNITTPAFRKNQYEALIATLLRSENIEFEQNNRSILSGKELDFYIPSLNLAIECNGIFWHSECMGKDRNYHLHKTEECNRNGIRLLQFWDYQIDNKWPVVSSMILNAIGRIKMKIGARMTTVLPLSNTECIEFFKENHLQDAVNSSLRYGLFYKGELVSAMCFGKSRFAKDEYELLRFANKCNWQIPGGASKLLAAFLKNSNTKKLISYANRDISIGDVYIKLGFTEVSKTPPSYMYFYNRSVYNRIKFQKHKLSKLLIHYNPDLSEWDNMKQNGYNRFWTTGNIKYEFTKYPTI